MNEISEFKELINEANNQEFILIFQLKIKEIIYLSKIALFILVFQLIFYFGSSILSLLIFFLFSYIAISLYLITCKIEKKFKIDIKLVNFYIQKIKQFEPLIIILLLWDVIDMLLIFVNSDMQMLKNSESIHKFTFYKLAIMNTLIRKILIVSILVVVHCLEKVKIRKSSLLDQF